MRLNLASVVGAGICDRDAGRSLPGSPMQRPLVFVTQWLHFVQRVQARPDSAQELAMGVHHNLDSSHRF